MRTARRYLAREIYRSTAVVLLALVGLFIFFALIEGLDKVGTRLTLLNLFYLQFLSLPTHLYELLPIGLLIGAVLALASLAQRNELTILRSAGVSGMKLLGALWIATIPLVLGAFVLSEFITPAAELRGSESRLALLGRADGGRLESGYWFKETDETRVRVINIRQLEGRGSVQGVMIYVFDEDQALRNTIEAETGEFHGDTLLLRAVTETRIEPQSAEALADARARDAPLAQVVSRDQLSIRTSLTPERLIARVLTPERMSISDLSDYIGYLRQNHLQTDRQVVALWRKLAYPFTLLVMITIATPIGFMQTRRGGVGPKVFAGIILGVGFFMLNQLALNAGMLGEWPPWATALVPSMLSLGIALAAIFAMEHRHAIGGFLQRRRVKAGPA